MQRALWAARTGHRVEPIGFVERATVHGLQRVEHRSRVIVCVDALQVLPNQSTTADVPGHQLSMNLVDRGFLQVERCLCTDWRGDENECSQQSYRVQKPIGHGGISRSFSTDCVPRVSSVGSGFGRTYLASIPSISSITRFILRIVKSSGSSVVISTPAFFSSSMGYFDIPEPRNLR